MGSSFFLFALSFVASFFITAFGQGIWIPALGPLAGAFGIAWFWHSLRELSFPRHRFWASVIWFLFVQMIQISWLASTRYMGFLILVVYLLLCLAIALQFGLIYLLFFDPASRKSALPFYLDCDGQTTLPVAPLMIQKRVFEQKITVIAALAAAGCWTWFEWFRTFLLTGFTWNPIGLALCSSVDSLQAASVWGVYGLSFWVIFANAMALRAMQSRSRLFQWILVATLPYGYGLFRQAWIERQALAKETVSVAIVQTPFLPEQRDNPHSATHIPPLSQWESIWEALETAPPLDLIVFPESTVSLGAYKAYYPHFLVESLWSLRFKDAEGAAFPALHSPMAAVDSRSYAPVWKVSNAFIAQAIANHFKAHVIAGFEDSGEQGAYNAAFHFSPENRLPVRYEKRILVPVGEYIPFPKFERLTRFLAQRFQIGDSFSSGSEAKLFHLRIDRKSCEEQSAEIPAGISICLEEAYSQAIRELRLKGARLLINISNDVWFPNTQLPRVHLEHARLRCVENGVYAVRSCNKGISAVIDFKGNVLTQIPASRATAQSIFSQVPIAALPTLYTLWGDFAILGISLVCLICSSFLSINSPLR